MSSSIKMRLNTMYVTAVCVIFIMLKHLGCLIVLYACQKSRIRYLFFFFKHLSGPDAYILKFDWLILRTWPVRLFTKRPTGRIFSPRPRFRSEQLTVIINLLPSFTHPSTISQRKFIFVHFKMARKVTVSKFNCVFWSCESLFGCF